jgi:hypothetical protein
MTQRIAENIVGGKTLALVLLESTQLAVYDYGFRAVVSSFFDIFKGNCLNIGVLPVQVSPEFADTIFKAIENDPKQNWKLIFRTTITLKATGQKRIFDISDTKKDNMVNGFDDIDYLQNIRNCWFVTINFLIRNKTIKKSVYLKLNSIVKPENCFYLLQNTTRIQNY